MIWQEIETPFCSSIRVESQKHGARYQRTLKDTIRMPHWPIKDDLLLCPIHGMVFWETILIPRFDSIIVRWMELSASLHTIWEVVIRKGYNLLASAMHNSYNAVVNQKPPDELVLALEGFGGLKWMSRDLPPTGILQEEWVKHGIPCLYHILCHFWDFISTVIEVFYHACWKLN